VLLGYGPEWAVQSKRMLTSGISLQPRGRLSTARYIYRRERDRLILPYTCLIAATFTVTLSQVPCFLYMRLFLLQHPALNLHRTIFAVPTLVTKNVRNKHALGRHLHLNIVKMHREENLGQRDDDGM